MIDRLKEGPAAALAWLCCALSALTFGAAAGAEELLRAAHSSNPGQSVYIYWEEFATRVNEGAKGKLRVQVFPSGQLGGDEQIIQGLKSGTIQFGSASNGNEGTTTDAYFLFDLPYVMKSRDSAMKALQDKEVRDYLAKKLLTEARTVLLGHIEVGGFRIIANRKHAIHAPADMKGLKFRTLPTPIDRALFEAWGAIPAPLPWSETFTALDQGVIDGVNLQPQALVGFKFDEIVKYGVMPRALMAFHVAQVNAKTWDSLSPDMRALIVRASDEALAIANAADRADEERFLQSMKARGIEFYKPTEAEAKAWHDAGMSIYPRFKDKINASQLNRVMAAQK